MYTCAIYVYLMTVVSEEFELMFYISIREHGHGKHSVDALHKWDEIFISKKMKKCPRILS